MESLLGKVVGFASLAAVFVFYDWFSRAGSGDKRLFLLALGREQNARDRASLRRFRSLNILGAIVALLSIVLAPSAALSAVGVAVGTWLAAGSLVIESLLAARSRKEEEVAASFRVPLENRPRTFDFVSSTAIFIGISLLITTASLLTFFPNAHVPMLLKVMPFVMAGLGAFLVSRIAAARWVLPHSDAERFAALQLDRRRVLVRLLETTFIAVVSVLVLSLAKAILTQVAPFLQLVMTIAIGVAALCALLPMVFYRKRLVRVLEEIREMNQSPALGTRPGGWHVWGLLYFAPDDPAVFVPKRVGLGQTLNFARPGAWLFMVGIVGFVALTLTLS